MSFSETKKNFLTLATLLVVGLVFMQMSQAQDFSSTSFTVTNPVIDQGSSSSSSTNFGLGQSIGQTAIGKSTSTNFQLWSGFQYYFLVQANDLTATAGDGEVDLVWTVPGTFLGITVDDYEVGTGVASGSYVFESVGNITNFTKTGLTNDTPYFFIIKAKGPGGVFLVYSNEATATPVGAGGGGGGTGFRIPSLVVTGQAYPDARIFLVKDLAVVSTTRADSSGGFRLSIANLSAGSHSLFIYATDSNGLNSANLNFQATIVPSVTSQTNNLLVGPTLTTDYSIIKQGENLKISGFAPPNSPVVISLTTDGLSRTYNTFSNSSGRYEYILNTTSLNFGSYSLRSYAIFNSRQSPFSLPVSFMVGDRSVPREGAECGRSDLNCDGRVDLVDFSILLYFWEGEHDLSRNPRADIDGSGVADLVDFSIMLYDWTG